MRLLSKITVAIPLAAVLAALSVLPGCTVSVVGTGETTAAETTIPYLIDDTPGRVYPVIIGDVAIQREPERIVCLSPLLTELVCEFGELPRIVGRCSACDFPAAVTNAADTGSGVMPDTDAIARLTPDLILTSSALPKRTVAEMSQNGAVVVTIKSPTGITEFRDTYRTLGRILYGNEVGAAKGDAVFAPTAKFCNNSEVISVGRFIYVTEGLRVAGAGTLESDILSCFGENAAASVSSEKYHASKSALVNRLVSSGEPDVIFLNSKYKAEVLTADPDFGRLKAVQNGRIVLINGERFERPTTRVITLLVDIKTAKVDTAATATAT